MAAFSTIAALAALGVSAGVGTHQALQQRQAQKLAKRNAQDAMEASRIDAIRTQRENDMALGAANRRKPDLLGILNMEERAATARAGATMLTGPLGVDPNSMPLGGLGI